MEPALPDHKETIQILWVLFATAVIIAAIILISKIGTASADPQPSVFNRCMTALGYNPPDDKTQPEASKGFRSVLAFFQFYDISEKAKTAKSKRNPAYC